jgi:Fungal specific transcription factor domain
LALIGRIHSLYVTVVKHIAPLHYPHGRVAERDPMTIRWIAAAVTDEALLHSTLGSSGGHMLYYANLPTLSPSFLASFLSHKTETLRIINERVKDTSKILTDESLGAIALLITGQTCQGDYNEMSIHMRGLSHLVSMRGGLKTLGMSGLLTGEILW